MSPITIYINQQKQSIPPQNLAQLIESLKIHRQQVAIALNNEVIPSCDYQHTELKNDDHLEIIQAVCGG